MKRLCLVVILMGILGGFLFADECPMDGLYMSMNEPFLHNGDSIIMDQTIYLRSNIYQEIITVGVDVNTDGALTDEEISIFFAKYTPQGILWFNGNLAMMFTFNENYGIYILHVGNKQDLWIIPMTFVSR